MPSKGMPSYSKPSQRHRSMPSAKYRRQFFQRAENKEEGKKGKQLIRQPLNLQSRTCLEANKCGRQGPHATCCRSPSYVNCGERNHACLTQASGEGQCCRMPGSTAGSFRTTALQSRSIWTGWAGSLTTNTQLVCEVVV